MYVENIRQYLEQGGTNDLRIEIKKPDLNILDPSDEHRMYEREEVEEVLGIKLNPTIEKERSYYEVLELGLKYRIFGKWLKALDKKKVGSTYVHKADYDVKIKNSVIPQLNGKDFLVEYVQYTLDNIPKTRDRRILTERYYWGRRLLVVNGRDPEVLSFPITLTDKQKREWIIMNIDYDLPTRHEVLRAWEIGEWKKLDGKLIKRCSKSMFKWEGNGPLIRLKRLPLIGYENDSDNFSLDKCI